MTWYQRIFREPALLLAAIAAGLALAVAFGVHLSDTQTGAVLGFFAAIAALLRFIMTPSSEVIAQQKPGQAVRATPQAEEKFGIPADQVVAVKPAAA